MSDSETVVQRAFQPPDESWKQKRYNEMDKVELKLALQDAQEAMWAAKRWSDDETVDREDREYAHECFARHRLNVAEIRRVQDAPQRFDVV